MNIEFRLPSLTASDGPGQIRQLHGFLRQTVEQLNWALGQIDTTSAAQNQPQTQAQTTQAQTTQATVEHFANLKGLIIKSADIVSAYYDTIDQLLTTSGKYVAQSDFGDYQEEVNQDLSAQTDRITQNIERTEQIGNQLRTQDSYLRYGAVGTTLDETNLATENAAGIEIGDFHSYTNGAQTNTSRRFARFTAYGLELFGSDKTHPIAYISGNRLYITNAEIRGNLKLGGYQVSTENGLAFNWVGG